MKDKDQNQSLKETIFKVILFVILFLLWEAFIIRPLRNRASGSIEKDNVDFSEQDTNNERELKSTEQNKIVVVENDYLKVSVDAKGLVLNNILLKKYTKSVDDKNLVQLLLDSENNKYYINHSWMSSGVDDLPNSKTSWTFDEEEYKRDKSRLIFTYKNRENIIFKNTLYLDDKYLLILKQEVINNGKNNINVRPIIEINKSDTINKEDVSVFNGAIGVFDKDRVEEIKIKKINKKNIEFNSFEWSGFTNKYWLVSLINNDSHNGKVNFLKKNNLIKMQYTTQNDFVVDINNSVVHTIKIFLGVKDNKILDEYKAKENLKLFDRSVDYGSLFLITKPLSIFLNLINKICKNFGLSIIIFTILTRMALYPLVKKSSVSMIKFRKIQPKIKQLQDRYSNDKLTFQKELIKLYSETKANPMAGIVPLFIQIPLFFSLYKVLNISLEMRQAKFIWFIRDLSVSDPTNIINLFGLLPFKPIVHIGILPLLMAISMIIQQKVSSSYQKNLNDDVKEVANSGKYLPWIFLFIFSGFPSGLLIYWIFSNVISILQQIYIEHKYGD